LEYVILNVSIQIDKVSDVDENLHKTQTI